MHSWLNGDLAGVIWLLIQPAQHFLFYNNSIMMLWRNSPKFSWHKSQAWKDMRYHKDPQALIEDYEGMTFWLTVNPYHYFPDSWKKGYSEWLAPLGVAFGVSAKDIGWYPWAG